MSRIPITLITFTFIVSVAFGQSATEEFNFAAGLHDRGLHERAVQAFERFLTRFEDDKRAPRAHFYLGQSLVELARDREALPHFRSYVRSGEKPLRARALLRAGELQFRLGKPRLAVQSLSTLLDEGADGDVHEAALYFAGEAYGAAGDKKRARANYERLLRDHPAGTYAAYTRLALGFLGYEARDFDQALTQFQAVAHHKPDPELAAEARAMVGESLLELKRHDEAFTVFDAALRRGPGRFESAVRRGLAQAKLGSGDFDEATKHWIDFVRRYADEAATPKAIARTAATLHEKGRGADGLRLLRELQSRRDDFDRHEDLVYWMGRLLDAGGDTDGALRELERASGTSPRRKFAYGDALSRAGRHEAAAEVFAELRNEKDAALRAEAAFAEAFSRHELGQHEAAVSVLTRLLHGRPTRELARDATFALGENLFALGRHDEAAQWFGRVIASGAGAWYAESLYKAGWCAWRQKQSKQALEHFEKLLETGVDDALATEVTYMMGKCLEAEGRHDEAGRIFTKVAKSDDGRLGVKARIGAAAAARRDGRNDEALRLYRQTLQSARDDAMLGEAMASIGEIALEQSDVAAAEKMLRRMLREQPNHPRTRRSRLLLGWACHKQDRRDETVEIVEPLTAANVDADLRGEALYLVGLARHESDDHAGAVSALERLVDDLSDHRRVDETQLLLGVSLARIGRGDEASARLAKASRSAAQSAIALYEWAFVREKSGDTGGRDELFMQLVREHSTSELVADALFRLGESAYAAKKFDEALGHYAALVKNEHAGALVDKATYKSAWCLRQLDRHAAAAKRFVEVADMARSSFAAEACYLAGDAFHEAGEHDAAAQWFAELVRRAPKHEHASDAACRQIVSLSEAKRHDDVVKNAPRVLDRHGDHVRVVLVWSALGDALAAKRNWSRARAAYRKVTEKSDGPLGARAQLRRGECFREEGESDRAIDELLKVTILYGHPEWSAKATWAAARLLEKAGQKEKAKKLDNELLRDYPKSPEAKKVKTRGRGA